MRAYAGDLPSVVLRNRLDRALDCYEQNPDLLIIVSGGMGEGESSTEASVMKKWLVAAGVPADSIIEEGKSQSTEENFIFSFDIINRLFDGSGAAAESNPRVAFVTTRFHVFRASRIAKKLGYDVNGVSAKDFSLLIVNNYLRECAWRLHSTFAPEEYNRITACGLRESRFFPAKKLCGKNRLFSTKQLKSAFVYGKIMSAVS